MTSTNHQPTIKKRPHSECGDTAFELPDDEKPYEPPDEGEQIRQKWAQERKEKEAKCPTITALWGLFKKYPKLRPPIIDGLLREGETANIVSPTKVGKSWGAYGLMLSVVTGRPWLGLYNTTPCNVLLIDNELHPEVLSSRIKRVCSAMSISEPYKEVVDHIDVLSLRGRLLDLFQIAEELQEIEPGYYGLIVLDALYRAIPEGTSENDNSQMGRLYNLVDSIAAQTGAGVVLIDHSTKGSQGEKNVTDVGAGAGSKARAADAHITLREHEEPGVYVMEARVRSFPPVQPICLKWFFPCWQPDPMLDPTRLRTTKSKRKPDPEKVDRQASRRAERDADDDRHLLEQIDKAAKSKTPVAKSTIRDKAGLDTPRLNRAMDRLNDAIEEYDVDTEMPNGGIRKGGKSLRRKTRSGCPDVRGELPFSGNSPDMSVCVEKDVRSTSVSHPDIHPGVADVPEENSPDIDPVTRVTG